MAPKKMIISFIALFAIVGLYLLGLRLHLNPKIISKEEDTVRLEGRNIAFKEFGAENFTCTGLTWDDNDKTFWIGDYGAMSNKDTPSPRVVEVSRDLSEIVKLVDLSEVLSSDDNLQGIAYDELTNSLWLAVGDTVKNISKDGALIFEFDLGKYTKYKSNGICVDETDDSLWVLCRTKYLLHYDKSGNLIKEYQFNYKDQDQIFLYDGMMLVTVGADYTGEENYIVSINIENGNISVPYQISEAYAVEGICVVEDKMYIANDGLYHDAKIKESYISVFEFGAARTKTNKN